MDIHMPEMDGIEATRQIRNVHDASALPIIGLTAEAFLERHALFMDAGLNGVSTKPFTEQQLRGILVQHMPKAAFAAIPNESSPPRAIKMNPMKYRSVTRRSSNSSVRP